MISRGGTRPLVIESAFLFESGPLLAALRNRGVKLGPATSVAKHFWVTAEIYPTPKPGVFVLSAAQRTAIEIFSGLEANSSGPLTSVAR
ncbi:hypothetical protein D3C87_1390830 [compost metagenome]